MAIWFAAAVVKASTLRLDTFFEIAKGEEVNLTPLLARQLYDLISAAKQLVSKTSRQIS